MENWGGPDISGHPVWNIRSKTPNTVRMTVPWHQDSAYLVEGAEKTIQPAAWIPFLDVNKKNGCMQVVKGGHKSGKIFKHKLESKAGIKDSWYLYIDDAEIKQDDISTIKRTHPRAMSLDNSEVKVTKIRSLSLDETKLKS